MQTLLDKHHHTLLKYREQAPKWGAVCFFPRTHPYQRICERCRLVRAGVDLFCHRLINVPHLACLDSLLGTFPRCPRLLPNSARGSWLASGAHGAGGARWLSCWSSRSRGGTGLGVGGLKQICQAIGCPPPPPTLIPRCTMTERMGRNLTLLRAFGWRSG